MVHKGGDFGARHQIGRREFMRVMTAAGATTVLPAGSPRDAVAQSRGTTMVIAAPATPQSLDHEYDVSLGTIDAVGALYDNLLEYEKIPDPLAEKTFRSAVLDWSEPEQPHAQERMALVRQLLAIRRREIVSRLANSRFGSANREGSVITAHWRLGDGSRLALIANLSDEGSPQRSLAAGGRTIWTNAEPNRLPPWSVCWTVGAA